MDKSSFLIYLDYEEQFNLLTDEQVGQLMRAIIKYEKNRENAKKGGRPRKNQKDNLKTERF